MGQNNVKKLLVESENRQDEKRNKEASEIKARIQEQKKMNILPLNWVSLSLIHI